MKCKYMFMFPLQNLARKGLINGKNWTHLGPLLLTWFNFISSMDK